MEGTVYGSLASEFCLGHLGAVGRLDSYVVAGNHAKRVLSEDYLFQTEEHKNKRFIECSNVCSSELDIPLSFQCLHLWCLAFSLFVGTNTSLGVYFLIQTEEHKNKRLSLILECSCK